MATSKEIARRKAFVKQADKVTAYIQKNSKDPAKIKKRLHDMCKVYLGWYFADLKALNQTYANELAQEVCED